MSGLEKAVFLADNPPVIHRVYSEETRKNLTGELEFPEDIITSGTLGENADFLSRAKYLFSTWSMPSLTAERISEYLPELKAVFYAAGSVQHFARPFLERGITVCSAWAANGIPVAEFTVAQIILANKGYFQAARRARSSYRTAGAFTSGFAGNYGAVVGVIGAGVIGKLVIKMLKQYRLDILVFDPFLPDETAAQLGVEKTSLEDIFRRCDVVSNHLANNAQTQGMINASHFSLMKKNATFINTGRGQQVAEAGMIAALKANPDLTALLDVTYPEPPAQDSELYTLDNVFLTPHIAGSSGLEVHRMAEFMYGEYRRIADGLSPEYGVTLEMLRTMA